MKPDPNDAVERYPLRSLATALRRFAPPGGAFDPAGAWRQAYGVYTLAGRQAAARRVGVVRLARRVAAGGEVVLEVEYRKALTGGSQRVSAELHTRADDALATPSRWQFETKLLDAAGKVIPRTHLKRSAAFRDGRITIRDARETKVISVAGAWTVSWCLFDAVQRLPARRRKPIALTLIDHFDEPKGGCTLACRGEMDVAVAGGRTIRTWAFDQLSDGNVPWVYWRDERGRLLFIVAGLEAYLLEPAGPA